MTFQAFGLNHETAPVPVREAFALSDAVATRIMAGLALPDEAEVILLSTCNRTEVYLFGASEHAQAIRDVLARKAKAAWPADHDFHLEDEAAILHVLRVTSGVASQVIGDAQILAQMKQAYRLAAEAGRVGTVLHRLMHTAFRTAKRVRAETTLCDGAASVSSAAVQAARMHFEQSTGEGMDARQVLLVGLGHMGLAALRSLCSFGVDRIALANRSRERAEELAAEFDATVVSWEDRHRMAARADLVIVSSAAPEPILHAAELPARAGGPALVVDVAVPRNVDPAVAQVEGYQLIDIDDLNAWRDNTASHRAAALPAAEGICDENLREFVGWVLHHEALQPALHALRDTFEDIRREAIEQHGHRFTGADREDLDRLTRSILQKLLAVPIVRLKASEPDSLEFVRGVRFLSQVFSRPGCEDGSARDLTGQTDETPLPKPDDEQLHEAPPADATRDAGQ